MSPLAGRSILVTGATGALGSRVATRLAAAGAGLTLTGRDEARLRSVTAAAAGDPTGAGMRAPGHVRADLSVPGEPERVVATAVAVHGRLDGVVHAAGVVAFGPVDTLDDDVLDELLLVNAVAPMRLLRAALPALRESAAAGREPFACHISAVVAERPQPGMAAYSASKAALAAFDAAAAGELRRARIRLVDVRPPHTETGLAARPIAGSAPPLPAGKAPDDVADRIVAAITGGERDLPSGAF
jgi:cyclic-di-GMP-binding biofilm dispersal mediator protein